LERIVGGILQYFGAANHGQHGGDSHHGVTRQCQTRQDIERSPNAHEVEDPRDGESLEQQSQQVHPAKVVAVESADEAPHRRLVAGKQARRFLFNNGTKQKFSGGVDDV